MTRRHVLNGLSASCPRNKGVNRLWIPWIPTDRNAPASNPPLIWINAHQPTKCTFQVAQGEEVTSARAVLAEPLRLLGTCTVAVSAAFSAFPRGDYGYIPLPLHQDRPAGPRRLADHPGHPEKQSYEAVTCPACGGVHLVNPATGKTINDDDKKPA